MKTSKTLAKVKNIGLARVNIGLAHPHGGFISVGKALSALIRIGYPALSFRIEVSRTEPTVVATVKGLPSARELYRLSVLCEQEAVAAFDGVTGLLEGPEAHKWGEFNLDYFIQ